MTRSRLGVAVGTGLILAALAVGSQPPEAGASVVSQSGQAVWGVPVTNVIEGFSESNTTMHLFEERSDLVLPSALPVDISPPTTYPKWYDSVNQLNPTDVPQTTLVDSYFLYSDPVGTPSVPLPYSATVTFSTPILGVITEDATLDATDAMVGVPGTTYSTSQVNRGLELGNKLLGEDTVELVAPNALHLDVNTYGDIDSMRVITAGSLPNSFNGALPHYTEVAADGGIFNFGTQYFGSMGGMHLNKPMVSGSEAFGTPGYWAVASDGGVFSFGGARFEGSAANLVLAKPIVGVASTPDGLGYWLAASDGGVFAFGDAGFFGSAAGRYLKRPVVGIAATPDGKGYWLVAAGGRVLTYGDAGFFGAVGSTILNKPVVGIAATPDGRGYWLVAADGGVFTYGDARFFGSTGDMRLNQPIVDMKVTADGGGYWLFAADGGVFAFGNARFLGSMGATRLDRPIVGGF